MRNEIFQSCLMAAFLFANMQSLADAARKEAERRRLLQEQNVEAKVIEIYEPAKDAQEPAPASIAKKTEEKKKTRDYRGVLQKLDNTIQKEENRRQSLRERMQSMRRAPPRISTRSVDTQSINARIRLQSEINESEERLRQLRRQRTETYEEGLKAGLLPGELDGKGVIP